MQRDSLENMVQLSATQFRAERAIYEAKQTSCQLLSERYDRELASLEQLLARTVFQTCDRLHSDSQLQNLNQEQQHAVHETISNLSSPLLEATRILSPASLLMLHIENHQNLYITNPSKMRLHCEQVVNNSLERLEPALSKPAKEIVRPKILQAYVRGGKRTLDRAIKEETALLKKNSLHHYSDVWFESEDINKQPKTLCINGEAIERIVLTCFKNNNEVISTFHHHKTEDNITPTLLELGNIDKSLDALTDEDLRTLLTLLQQTLKTMRNRPEKLFAQAHQPTQEIWTLFHRNNPSDIDNAFANHTSFVQEQISKIQHIKFIDIIS